MLPAILVGAGALVAWFVAKYIKTGRVYPYSLPPGREPLRDKSQEGSRESAPPFEHTGSAPLTSDVALLQEVALETHRAVPPQSAQISASVTSSSLTDEFTPFPWPRLEMHTSRARETGEPPLSEPFHTAGVTFAPPTDAIQSPVTTLPSLATYPLEIASSESSGQAAFRMTAVLAVLLVFVIPARFFLWGMNIARGHPVVQRDDRGQTNAPRRSSSGEARSPSIQGQFDQARSGNGIPLSSPLRSPTPFIGPLVIFEPPILFAHILEGEVGDVDRDDSAAHASTLASVESIRSQVATVDSRKTTVPSSVSHATVESSEDEGNDAADDGWETVTDSGSDEDMETEWSTASPVTPKEPVLPRSTVSIRSTLPLPVIYKTAPFLFDCVDDLLAVQVPKGTLVHPLTVPFDVPRVQSRRRPRASDFDRLAGINNEHHDSGASSPRNASAAANLGFTNEVVDEGEGYKAPPGSPLQGEWPSTERKIGLASVFFQSMLLKLDVAEGQAPFDELTPHAIQGWLDDKEQARQQKTTGSSESLSYIWNKLRALSTVQNKMEQLKKIEIKIEALRKLTRRHGKLSEADIVWMHAFDDIDAESVLRETTANEDTQTTPSLKAHRNSQRSAKATRPRAPSRSQHWPHYDKRLEMEYRPCSPPKLGEAVAFITDTMEEVVYETVFLHAGAVLDKLEDSRLAAAQKRDLCVDEENSEPAAGPSRLDEPI